MSCHENQNCWKGKIGEQSCDAVEAAVAKKREVAVARMDSAIFRSKIIAEKSTTLTLKLDAVYSGDF